jgi:hypothetical protein
MSTITSPRTGARIAWGAFGAFLVAFGVFEAVKHGGLAWPLFFAGALIPAIPGLPRSVQRWVLHFPVAPLVVIAYFSIFPTTNDLAAPGFTLGLMWLAHIAISRAYRPHRTVRELKPADSESMSRS